MHALVRTPGPRLADGIITHLERVPVDVARATAQHRAYVEALRSHGRQIVEVEPADAHPDAVFVEDTVVVCDRLAVLTRSGAPERRGEVTGTAAALRSLDGAARPEIVRLEEPATLDGGDVLQVGNTVYVGRGGRTNDAGIAQLAEHLRSRGRRVVPVDFAGVLHLKSGATALPDGTLIGHPDHVDLPDLLVPPEHTGAFLVLLDDRTVLMAASAPETAALLRARGLEVITTDISEYEKLEGCVTCLSVLVDG